MIPAAVALDLEQAGLTLLTDTEPQGRELQEWEPQERGLQEWEPQDREPQEREPKKLVVTMTPPLKLDTRATAKLVPETLDLWLVMSGARKVLPCQPGF